MKITKVMQIILRGVTMNKGMYPYNIQQIYGKNSNSLFFVLLHLYIIRI